jgi:hypothetical protein
VTDFVMFIAPAFVVVTLVGMPLLAIAVMTFRKRKGQQSKSRQR